MTKTKGRTPPPTAVNLAAELAERFGTSDPAQQLQALDGALQALHAPILTMVVQFDQRSGRVFVHPIGSIDLDNQQMMIQYAGMELIHARREQQQQQPSPTPTPPTPEPTHEAAPIPPIEERIS